MPTQWTPQVIAAEKARKQAANIPLNYGKPVAAFTSLSIFGRVDARHKHVTEEV